MKYLLPAIVVCAMSCGPVFAAGDDGDYVPPPSRTTSAPRAAADELPWKHGAARSQQAVPASSVQDVQSTTQTLSNSIQGAMQNLNQLNNNVGGISNGIGGGALGMGAAGMQGRRFINPSEGLPQGVHATYPARRMNGGMGGPAAQQLHLAHPNAPTGKQQKAWEYLQNNPNGRSMSNQQMTQRHARRGGGALQNIVPGGHPGAKAPAVQVPQRQMSK